MTRWGICFFLLSWESQQHLVGITEKDKDRKRKLDDDNRQGLDFKMGNIGSAEGQLVATCCTDRFQSSGTRPVFLLEEFLDGASIPLRDHVGPQLHEVWPQTQLLQQGVSVHPAGGGG